MQREEQFVRLMMARYVQPQFYNACEFYKDDIGWSTFSSEFDYGKVVLSSVNTVIQQLPTFVAFGLLELSTKNTRRRIVVRVTPIMESLFAKHCLVHLRKFGFERNDYWRLVNVLNSIEIPPLKIRRIRKNKALKMPVKNKLASECYVKIDASKTRELEAYVNFDENIDKPLINQQVQENKPISYVKMERDIIRLIRQTNMTVFRSFRSSRSFRSYDFDLMPFQIDTRKKEESMERAKKVAKIWKSWNEFTESYPGLRKSPLPRELKYAEVTQEPSHSALYECIAQWVEDNGDDWETVWNDFITIAKNNTFLQGQCGYAPSLSWLMQRRDRFGDLLPEGSGLDRALNQKYGKWDKTITANLNEDGSVTEAGYTVMKEKSKNMPSMGVVDE